MRRSPIRGRSILVTRPAERAGELARKLRALGAIVDLRPSIAFEPPRDSAAPLRAVERLDSYDWLVFTSPTGVEFFSELAERVRGPATVWQSRIAVIGAGTARALDRIGVGCDLIARESQSEGLAAGLRERSIAGQRLLVVKPEVSRPTLASELSAAGALVEAVSFYRTVPAPGARETASMVAADRFEVLVFTSPSTYRMLFEVVEGAALCGFREGLRRAKRVAIGTVTAAALEEEGVPADRVAREPDDEAIVDAVVELFEDSSNPDETTSLC